MIVTLTYSDPWMRERRFKDKHGRIVSSEFVVYAKVSGSTHRLCAFSSAIEALDYMRGLTRTQRQGDN